MILIKQRKTPVQMQQMTPQKSSLSVDRIGNTYNNNYAESGPISWNILTMNRRVYWMISPDPGNYVTNEANDV